MTIELLASRRLTSASSIINLTNILQDGTDLLVMAQLKSSAAIADIRYTFNGDQTGGNYSYRTLNGTGGSGTSGTVTSTSGTLAGNNGGPLNGDTSIYQTHCRVLIPNYTSSVAKTSFVQNSGGNFNNFTNIGIISNSWVGTVPITAVRFECIGGQFIIGSEVYIYKITKGRLAGV
jgi:hypothetical protein